MASELIIRPDGQSDAIEGVDIKRQQSAPDSIPEGWRSISLGRFAKITSGGTPDRSNPQFWNGTIPWVTTGEIGDGPVKSTREHISDAGLKSSAAKVFPAGTLLLAMYGQGKTRGRVSQLKIDAATNQACAAIITATAEDASFLLQNLAARYDEIRNLANDGSQKNLSAGLLKALPILLPPPHERGRIANILSTWDRAIEATEALIANAHQQKVALMQALLTGERRLPGFAPAWAPQRLSSMAEIIVSNVDKKSRPSEHPVRLCNYTDVYASDRIEADRTFMAATASSAQIRRFRLHVGDVLITKDSETPQDIAVPSYVASTSPDLVCGYHLAIIRPRKADGQFLKYLLEHPASRQYFASRANGATRFGLTVGAIEEAPLTVPELAEQRAVGEVIRTAEVSLHRQTSQLAALRDEKAALMQQLLTGKRRIKLAESEAA